MGLAGGGAGGVEAGRAAQYLCCVMSKNLCSQIAGVLHDPETGALERLVRELMAILRDQPELRVKLSQAIRKAR